MDLRSGRIVLETDQDARRTVGGRDDIEGPIVGPRKFYIFSKLPVTLTASETREVIDDLREKARVASKVRASSNERDDGSRAAETLALIAELGLAASVELAARTEQVQDITEGVGSQIAQALLNMQNVSGQQEPGSSQ